MEEKDDSSENEVGEEESEESEDELKQESVK